MLDFHLATDKNAREIQDSYKDVTVALDYDSSNNLIYVGLAASGTSQNATGWQIRKLTWSSNNLTKVEFASGTIDYDKAWSSRTGYVYS